MGDRAAHLAKADELIEQVDVEWLRRDTDCPAWLVVTPLIGVVQELYAALAGREANPPAPAPGEDDHRWCDLPCAPDCPLAATPPAEQPEPWLPDEFVVESDGSVWAVGPDGSRSMARTNPDNEGGRPDVARYVKVTWDGDEPEMLMEDVHREVMDALGAPEGVRGVMVDLALDKFRAALGHRPPPPEPREDAAANSKPAPSSAKTWRNEREDAVEALARVLFQSCTGVLWSQARPDVQQAWRRHSETFRAHMDAGRVPGYGRTAGEVVVEYGAVHALVHYQPGEQEHGQALAYFARIDAERDEAMDDA